MIKQFVPEKVCLNCLGCCRFGDLDTIWAPSLLNEEIGLIGSNKRVKLEPTQNGNNFICSFLNLQDNKCKIYNRRPFECQLYPFLINRKGNKIFLAADLKCPFVKEKLDTEEFKQYVSYLVELLNLPAYEEILTNNPHIIQTYPDVLNLSEL